MSYLARFRRHSIVFYLVILAISAVAAPAFLRAKEDASPNRPRVLVAPYSGIISPVASEFLLSAIGRAEAGRYDAVVIELDTPGGLDTSMRSIVKGILASKVPVVVYVYPSGGRAASAGVFITLSAHIAAMAPGTNIGAAHPLMVPETAGGAIKEEKPQDKTLEGKLVNDAAAYIKSIARERGRNEQWAFLSVTQSTSIPAMEAARMGVVDLTSPSLGELLDSIDGRTVPGLNVKLHTAGAVIDTMEMSQRQRWLAAISDPNVAMILMSLGAAGLLVELYNPGLIFPGIAGVISLVLAFYSFQTLSASYAGVLLILLGLFLFLLEIKVTSYGVLSFGAIVSMLFGILLLFQKEAAWGLQVSLSVALGTVGGLTGVTALCSYIVYKAYHRKVVTGSEAMVGARGVALTALKPRGKVQVHGELWDAVVSASVAEQVPEGASVVVESVDGLTLIVRPAS